MPARETTKYEHFERRDIEIALANILASNQFSSSSQLSSFLKYIVTKKLDGLDADIKAYSIAVDALGRPEGFDPQESAFVRVAAGRLRQALALYNANQPADTQEIRIVLEPGSYVPEFIPANAADAIVAEPVADSASVSDEKTELIVPASQSGEPPSARSTDLIDQPIVAPPSPTFASKWWRLVVAGIGLAVLANLAIGVYLLTRPANIALPETNAMVVEPAPADAGFRPRIAATMELPDTSYPEWFKSGELAESVGVIMARFDEYQFQGVRTALGNETAEPFSNIDYHLKLTAYRRDDSVRFFVNLISMSTGSVIWSTERLFDRPERMAGRNVPDIIGRAYSPVASPYGVLYANLSTSLGQRNGLACVIAGYKYFYSKSAEKHREARACGEAMVERGTRLQSIYAMLTFLYLDEIRENRNPRDRDPLDAAVKAAKRAVELGPQSARAHQALFATHKVQGHRELARSAAEKAIALNPYDADIIGDYAAWLVSIGDIEKGQEYLTRVEGMLEARPAWLDFYRFLGAELSREFDTAQGISRMMDMKRSPLLAIAVAIGAHSRGDNDEAKRALEELIRVEPGFQKEPMEHFLNRGFDEKIARALVERLRLAGLDRVALP